MTLRHLVLSDEAVEDIARRAEMLRDARGAAFALDWTDALLDWLERIAEAGAQPAPSTRPRPSSRPSATAARPRSSATSSRKP